MFTDLEKLIRDWSEINSNIDFVLSREIDMVFSEVLKEIAKTQIIDTKLAFSLLRQISRDVFRVEIEDSDFPETDLWDNKRKKNRVAEYGVAYEHKGLVVMIDIENHEIYQQELGGTGGFDYPSQSEEALILGRPNEWKPFHVTAACDKANSGNLKGLEVALKFMLDAIIKVFETVGGV